ncbi:hypothetical protein K458DRAFT_285900, partial [Lentithecium fluviatile CBS 122367]
MNKNDYVRGKKRQRKRAPKAHSGCITCKTRRIKCDETKPDCRKCISTGRKCDGYVPITASKARESSSGPPGRPTSKGCTPYSVACSRKSIPVSHLFPLGISSNQLPGRAFHYFIHRSSIDLTGPLHSQVWQGYVLSVCTTSPAIQHAVAALSGFHERFSF